MAHLQGKSRFGLAIALAITTAAVSLPSAAAAANLTGAGSTLVAPLEKQWAASVQSQGINVTYGSVGSGTGIADITSRTVDFGASDAPLTAAQASSCNSCVQIPWALTATGIAFHINGVSRLYMSPQVLAQIYLGQITNWSAPQIKKLNKGVTLPNLAITPVYRTDGSGDTYAFTDLESRVSSTFASKIGTATSVSFPVGAGGKGNSGVSAVVSSTNGSVAYIAASYIAGNGLGAAALENAAGKFVYPNLSNIAAAAAAFPTVPANNEMHIVNPPKKAKTAYPLSTYTYAIVPTSAGGNASTLTSFISYAISGGAGRRAGAGLLAHPEGHLQRRRQDAAADPLVPASPARARRALSPSAAGAGATRAPAPASRVEAAVRAVGRLRSARAWAARRAPDRARRSSGSRARAGGRAGSARSRARR